MEIHLPGLLMCNIININHQNAGIDYSIKFHLLPISVQN